jgi:hypothetical protein
LTLIGVYFDDAEQFFALQKEAVEELRKHHEASAAWVKVTEDYRLSDWQYRKAKKKEKGGVLINRSPSGAVEIREGLVKHEIEPETAEAIAERGLLDHDLAGLQTLLAALSFGQGNCERLDTNDGLFNRVAQDLGVDIKNHWRPDTAFFGKRNREQLIGIAKECGYADGNGSFGAYKKSELTSSLVRIS